MAPPIRSSSFELPTSNSQRLLLVRPFPPARRDLTACCPGKIAPRMDPFFLWIEDRGRSSVWLREATTIWAFPFVLVLHTIGLAFMVGVNVAIDLRALGGAMGVPLVSLRRYYRVMWAGFWVNAFSGVLLLIAYPTKALTNPIFYLKLTLIGVGVVLAAKIRVYCDGRDRWRHGRRASRLATAGRHLAADLGCRHHRGPAARVYLHPFDGGYVMSVSSSRRVDDGQRLDLRRVDERDALGLVERPSARAAEPPVLHADGRVPAHVDVGRGRSSNRCTSPGCRCWRARS